MKRYFAAAAIAVSLAALLAAPSHAQQYPSKPVNLVVPYSPGGAGDTAARKMADALSKRMGQPVVILNQAGVDGVIGATAVSRAVPDGYTLLAGDPGPINFAPLMRPGISYDPLKDFTLIAEYLYVPLIIVANPNTPFKTIKEMIAYAKANPGKVRIGYGSSLLQTGAELLKQRAGIDMLSVPYKAGAPSVQDTVAGHIDVVVTSTGPVSQLLAAGRLRPLAILGRVRDVLGQQVGDVGRHALGAKDSEPRTRLEIRKAGFDHRGHFGQRADAVAAQNGQRPEPSCCQ